MKKEFEIKRREEYDVAVLGGGTAGVSAAIAAKDGKFVSDIPIERSAHRLRILARFCLKCKL